MELDPVLLSRIQFGFTIAFHIIFPSMTIGLAAWLVILEAFWMKTGRPVYRELSALWTKIFALSFGFGVVSGLVLSYEFGTNWSVLSAKAGNIIGPLMSYEVLTAFFLEAGFLGIMLFGRDRVPKWLFLFATAMVAIGTLISTFWIISANSWMQTPAGYTRDENGVFHPADWMAIIFNPSFPYRLAHMVNAAYLSTAFFVAATGAFYLVRERHVAHGRVMVGMALFLIVWLAPAQLFIGDLHGLNVQTHQPVKVAAMEAHWESHRGAPLVLFALPDQNAERNRFEVAIPKLGSLILKHSLDGAVTGLKEFPRENRPHVATVFWSFRVMVGIGLVMIALGLIGGILWLARRLFVTKWYLRLLVAAAPFGFIAVISGWIVAEVGRQPWVVYGLLRTADAVSPVPGASVATSLALFVVFYTLLFGAGTYYLFSLLSTGPRSFERERTATNE